MTELIPQSELRGAPPRMICPRCGVHRYWEIVSGLQTSFLTGRFISIKCRSCGQLALWDQN